MITRRVAHLDSTRGRERDERGRMAQTHLLAIPNRDLLSSFAFNHYGTRIAASSLDHHVYVLSSDGPTGSWPEDDALSSSDDDHDGSKPAAVNGGTTAGKKAEGKNKGKVQAIRAHDGPVVKVVWADPMHGELLASGGTDGTVRIWEEGPPSCLAHPPRR